MDSFYQKAAKMIKRHEGCRLKPYKCTAGRMTIGYGRNLDDRGITSTEAEILLSHDMQNSISECADAVPFFNSLSDNRKAALTDMMFNLGKTRFMQFEQMLNAIERNDFEQAAAEMLSSRWADQVKGRAKELAAIMRKG